jgi:hypothetical protein
VFFKDPELPVDPMGLDEERRDRWRLLVLVLLPDSSDYEAGSSRSRRTACSNADTSKSTDDAEAKARKLGES